MTMKGYLTDIIFCADHQFKSILAIMTVEEPSHDSWLDIAECPFESTHVLAKTVHIWNCPEIPDRRIAPLDFIKMSQLFGLHEIPDMYIQELASSIAKQHNLTPIFKEIEIIDSVIQKIAPTVTELNKRLESVMSGQNPLKMIKIPS